MKQYPADKTLPKNLPLLLKQRVEKYPNINLQAAKNKNGEYEYFTYEKVYDDIISIALGLKTIGVKPKDNVAIISDNRREWLVTDFAIQSLGATDVPRGCDSLGNEIRFIIYFADCEIAVFENYRQLKKVLENVKETPNLKTVILFENLSDSELVEYTSTKCDFQLYTYEYLYHYGKKIYEEDKNLHRTEIENNMELIEPDDVATIIFTSGTTGVPKGVMLTHNNYIAQLSVFHNFIACKPGDWWMTILPVWHSFERMIQYTAILFGCGLAYSKPIASIMLADMAVIKPKWMCGVPRLWEALAKGVDKAMKKTGGIKLKLYRFFIAAGKAYANMKDLTLGNVCQFKKRCRTLDSLIGIIPTILLWPLHILGEILVFKKIKQKFGGNLSIAISGGGSLQKNIDDFYRAIGFTLLEGYGLTETAPVVSFRYYKHPRPGCVGIIFPTSEVKIVEDYSKKDTAGGTERKVVSTSSTTTQGCSTTTDNGDRFNGNKADNGDRFNELPPGKPGIILVRGPQIMKGYYKRPDLTEKVIDEDGFFNTGDIGILTYDNELKITGRAKDTIVLSGGENIEPAVIENELCTSPFIESAIVLGQDQKFLASLIVPAKDAVVEYAKKNGLDFSDYQKLIQTQQIQDLIFSEVKKDSTANGFRICERIAKIALLPESFKVGVELSAKQEMMRFKIIEKYSALIATLF